MTHESKKPTKTESKSTTSLEPPCAKPLVVTDGDAKGTVRILVYGSLKQKCGNHSLMDQISAKLLGYDSISGEFRMMSFGGFPGVVRTNLQDKPPVHTIFGELYSIDEEGLAALDMLESHPNFYERFKYRTDVLDYRAWMYTLPGGQGYLDTTRYDAVAECIWLPRDEELEFWNDQDGVTICVE